MYNFDINSVIHKTIYKKHKVLFYIQNKKILVLRELKKKKF